MSINNGSSGGSGGDGTGGSSSRVNRTNRRYATRSDVREIQAQIAEFATSRARRLKIAGIVLLCALLVQTAILIVLLVHLVLMP